MLDNKKLVEAAKLPAVVLVLMGVINAAVVFTMDWSVYTAISTLTLLISVAVLVWSGYNAVKKLKFDVVNAGMVGLLASVISAIVNGILNIFTMPIVAVKYSGYLPAGAVVAGFEVIGLLVAVILGAIVGFILSAIGGYIGQKQ